MYSLRKRYLFKLLTNIIGVPVSICTQLIVPRILGPKEFGDYVFLTNYFQQVTGFLDTGTSAYFYTRLSQYQKDISLIMFYYLFFGVGSLSIISLFFLVQDFHELIWPQLETVFVLYALVWGILYWFVQIANKMVDAFAITVKTEIINIAQKIIGLIFLGLMIIFGAFNLQSYFIFQYFMIGLLVVAFLFVSGKEGYRIWDINAIKKNDFRFHGNEMFKYSYPLFLYSLISLLVGLTDRWLLQSYGGSIQQGYFGLSYQVGTVCFIFTSAMTPLLTREFSIAYGQNDLCSMAHLFRRYIPLLYSIAAFFSLFIFSYSEQIALIIGGEDYRKASMSIMIMALYPIHQTYGQLSGSVFLATGQTKLYRNIGVVFLIVGLPFSFFLLAPDEFFGLNLGSTGLAIKMLVTQVFAVNTQLFFNSKFLKLKFIHLLFQQLVCSMFFLCISYFSSIFILLFFSSDITIVFLGGVIYTVLSIVGVCFFPSIIGIREEDIRRIRVYFSDQYNRFKSGW